MQTPQAPDGFTHVHSGKVRDLYRSPDGLLVMVASDRISAFDYVLDPGIPDKGRILTAMSSWWFDQLDVHNHVLRIDDPTLPSQWRGRATVCTELEMVPVEAVARGYLAGSGTLDYQASGAVCGVALPPGLVEGSKLPEPIFTPATKAAVGDHDENVSYEAVVGTVGENAAAALKHQTLLIYKRAAALAEEHGIILADTKFEFGALADRTLVLADEVLTPDSSRFWAKDEWQPGRTQPSYDKQIVRNWLLENWDPKSGARPPALAEDVIERTRARYIEAYERLTGEKF